MPWYPIEPFAIAALVIVFLIWIVARCLAYRKIGRVWFEALIPVWELWALGSAVSRSKSVTIAAVVSEVALAIVSIAAFAIGSNGVTFVLSLFLTVVYALSLLVINYKLARSVGHGVIYALGLWLLPPAFYLACGLSENEYGGAQ